MLNWKQGRGCDSEIGQTWRTLICRLASGNAPIMTRRMPSERVPGIASSTTGRQRNRAACSFAVLHGASNPPEGRRKPVQRAGSVEQLAPTLESPQGSWCTTHIQPQHSKGPCCTLWSAGVDLQTHRGAKICRKAGIDAAGMVGAADNWTARKQCVLG